MSPALSSPTNRCFATAYHLLNDAYTTSHTSYLIHFLYFPFSRHVQQLPQ
jgi:hypothetical protein